MGKTAVFVIATLQQLEPVDGEVSVLVLCHTVRRLGSSLCATARERRAALRRDRPKSLPTICPPLQQSDAPQRELAYQIRNEYTRFGKVRHRRAAQSLNGQYLPDVRTAQVVNDSPQLAEGAV